MTCSRCHGLMIATRLEEAAGATSGGPLSGWKCLLCGEVVDSVIAANRRQHDEPKRNRARLRNSAMPARAGAAKRLANG